jgi:predicted dehydrogenase
MKVAIVGCGYIADYYAATRAAHPELEWTMAWDHDAARLEKGARRWHVRAASSLDEICESRDVEVVLNLTNPRSHYAISRQCIDAGKHVYSEKPLGMTTAESIQLADLAESTGVQLASAPCSVLSETAQTLWHAIRSGVIGKVRIVYGNFEDGMIAPHRAPWTWKNPAGVPWPAKDEFETGCVYEHAGYLLTWLGAFFGPARRVTAFSSLQLPDKGVRLESAAPDFSVGCLEYDDGIVARLTFGLVAPRDKSLTVVGDNGVLFVGNVRDETCPVGVRPDKLAGWQGFANSRLGFLDRFLSKRFNWPGSEVLFQRQYPFCREPASHHASGEKRVDFLRGPAELVQAIGGGRHSRLSARFAAHIVELSERLQWPERFNSPCVKTTFAPIEPMPWAH